MLTLHIKLSRTGKALRKWAKSLIPQGKLASAICREVIMQLDKAQEDRILTNEEKGLRKTLKQRILGLAAIEKSRARQKSRMTWLRNGDANTKFFHLMANNRKKKNHIATLLTDQGAAHTHQEKEQIIHDHFQRHLGSHMPISNRLNFSALGWEPKQLAHLEAPFTEQEVLATIKQSPKEKAPGPDGYIGLFMTECWDIIKHDIMQAVKQFYNMNQQGLELLN